MTREKSNTGNGHIVLIRRTWQNMQSQPHNYQRTINQKLG